MRRSSLVALPVALGLLVTACGGGDGGESASTETDTSTSTATSTATSTETTGGGGSEQAAGCPDVTIASIHPLTGALALDGTQMDNAIKMAAKDLSGDGVTLEVKSADTQGAPETGQTEAQRLIQEGANVMIGAFQSAVTTNLATVAQREQVPLVIDVAVSDDITSPENDYTFRIQPNATDMGTFGAQYIKQVSEAQGDPVTSVVYMHEETNFGTSVFNAFKAEAANQGIDVVDEIVYNAFEIQDATTEMQKVASAAPDALVVTGYYNDGVLIAKSAASVQPKIKAIFGVAQGAFDLPQFPTDAPDASNGVFDSNYHFDATSDRVNKIRQAFELEYGDAMRTAAVLAYQAVEVIAQAAKNADSCDGPALQQAIQNVEVDDPLLTFPGPITFDDSGENENAQPVLMQVQDGKVVQVFPQQFAESDPQFPALPWTTQ